MASSPFDLLPVELIAEILLFNAGSLESVKARFNFPTSVTSVCRFWSSIILSTPHLWTSIYIPLKSCPHALIQRHLQMSENCRLELEVTLSAEDVWLEDKYRVSLTGILPHYARWKSLKLSTGTRVWADRAMSMMPTILPCLEELEIGVIDEFGDGGKLEVPLECPMLKDLMLRETSIAWDGCKFGGLRTLVIENDSWFLREFEGFLMVLSRSPGLESLDFNRICVDMPFSNGPGALEKVSLPNLRTLNIDDYVNGHSVRSLLSHVLIPKLESLSIKGAGQRCERWFEDIPTELPLLKVLSLERIVPMDRVAQSFVKKAPMLEALTACNPHDLEKSTLDFLRPRLSSSTSTQEAILCSRLSTLVVKNTWLPSLEEIVKGRTGMLGEIHVHRLDTLVKSEADWVDEIDHLLRTRDLASWAWLKENTRMSVWGELSIREQKLLGDHQDIEEVIAGYNGLY